jgi:transposase
VIHIAEGKGKESFTSFVQATEGRLDTRKVKLACMDLSPAFIAGCKETFPNARMVFDDFHVIKLMNDAINKICIEEARDNEPLKRTKFLWLTNPENLEERQEGKLSKLEDLDIKAAKAYQFKLALQRLAAFEVGGEEILKAVDSLGRTARDAGDRETGQDDTQPLRRHHREHTFEGDSRYAGGLNNKICNAFHRAYGFKAKEYRDTMIYLVAGRLTLPTLN